MLALSVSHVALSFSGVPLLKDVSFTLEGGDRAALVGANGAGKSTLLRILAGKQTPDAGHVTLGAGVSCGMLDQHALEGSEKSVFEEALAAHEALLETRAELARLLARIREGDVSAADRYDALSRSFEEAGGLTFEAKTRSALVAMGFSELLERPVSTLSGGQKTTLSLVKLLLAPPPLLLLDEPTNHLDLPALTWLEETVLSLKSTVLIVSHDRYFLDRVTTRTIELFAKKSEVYEMSYTPYRRAREARRREAVKHYELQQKEIRRQEAVIAKYRQFNREKSIRQAESRQKALDRIERLERPESEADAYRFSFPALPSCHDVLRADGLAFSFSQTPLLKDVSLEVNCGERLFLVGRVGAGKSTLLKLLAMRLSPSAGELRLGVGVRAGYYDQENQDLDLSQSVLATLWRSAAETSEGQLRSYLAAFGFCGDDVFRPVATLSGGERARLSLSRLMRRPLNLLFLDEPTNHLDMDSKEALEEALLAYPGTCIIVSHDRYFIHRCATKVCYLEGPGQQQTFPASKENLDAFWQSFSTQKKPAAPKDAPSRGATEFRERRRNLAEERRRKSRLRDTESRVREGEARLEAIQEKIALSYDDYQTLQTLYAEQAEVGRELEALYETLFALQTEDESE